MGYAHRRVFAGWTLSGRSSQAPRAVKPFGPSAPETGAVLVVDGAVTVRNA